MDTNFCLRPLDRLSILIVFPISWIMYFLKKVWSLWGFFASGSVLNGFRGVKKTTCRALSFSERDFHGIHLWNVHSFQFRGLIGIFSECPISREHHLDFMFSKQRTILGMLLPCSTTRQKKTLALSCANSLCNSDFDPTDMIHFLHVRPGRDDEPSLWSGNQLVSIFIHLRSLLEPMRMLGALAKVSLKLFSASCSLLLLDPFSVVSNSSLHLNSSMWSWISFTERFISLDVTAGLAIDNRNFHPTSIKNFHKLNSENEHSQHRGFEAQEIPRVAFPLSATQQQSCCPQRIWFVPVLLLSNRIYDIKLTICLEHEFCVHRMFIEVCGAFPPLQDSTSQCIDTLETRMTSFFESLFHFCCFRIPVLFFERKQNFWLFDDPGPKNVACLCEIFIA